MKVFFLFLTMALPLISVISLASNEIPIDRNNLKGAQWSYTVEFDQSMDGRTFYDHASRDGEGSYLLKFKVVLSNGKRLARAVRSEDEERLYAQATEMDKLLDDIQHGRRIPIGHGMCLVGYLNIRVDERPIQTVEKWFGGYDVVQCSR